jgi:hypothetical protein
MKKYGWEWLHLMKVLSLHLPGETKYNHEPLPGQLMTWVGFEPVISQNKSSVSATCLGYF